MERRVSIGSPFRPGTNIGGARGEGKRPAALPMTAVVVPRDLRGPAVGGRLTAGGDDVHTFPADFNISFGRRREQDCQAQCRLWGQVQVSPASVVAELDAVVGVALEAADDDDAISLAVLGTLVC